MITRLITAWTAWSARPGNAALTSTLVNTTNEVANSLGVPALRLVAAIQAACRENGGDINAAVRRAITSVGAK